MTWAPRRLKDGRELWPCPMCRTAGRTVWVGPDEQRGPVMLQVWPDRTSFCAGCGLVGGPEDTDTIRRMLDAPPDPSRALCLAGGVHRAEDARAKLREFARLLLRRCADDPLLTLELLWPWARLHVWPPPTYYECEAVLDDLAARKLRAVQ